MTLKTIATSAVVAALTAFAVTSLNASGTTKITFTHGALSAETAQSIDLGAVGHSVGDKLVVYIPLDSGGNLTGSLTTVAVDRPGVGQDIRTSELIFLPSTSTEDQIVVGGAAVYEITSPTLALGVVTTRPIVGGSGKYAGASGWLETTHNEDDTWVHVAYLTN